MSTTDPAFAKAMEAIVTSYYTRGVEAADRERARAERAYTIASAIAAVLVAAGVFGDLDERSTGVQLLGLLGLALWIAAAAGFVWAVAYPTPELPTPERRGWDTAQELAYALADHVKSDKAEVRRRERLAFMATAGAVAATLLAVVVAVLGTDTSTTREGTLSLRASGAATVAALCNERGNTITGDIDTATLEEPFVSISVDSSACPESGARTLQIARGQVRGVAYP